MLFKFLCEYDKILEVLERKALSERALKAEGRGT